MRPSILHGPVVLALLLAAPRLAAVELFAPGTARADLGGDVKTFFVGVLPYEHALMPDDPFALGALDLRLKLDAALGDRLSLTLHHQLALSSGQGVALGLGAAATGAQGEATAPQALDLSWAVVDGQGMQATLRVDRAFVRLELDMLDVIVGRQPVTFGSTFFFTPLDLVAAFSPTTIDREYKPGVDAARADLFLGTSGHLTLVAAYAGDWDLAQTILAARAGTTFDVWDVGLLAARSRGDLVLGVDVSGDVLGLALRAEGSVTRPRIGQPFVRASLGSDVRPGYGLTLMGELYVQSLGADDPADYLLVAADDRFARGELWAMGQYYAAISLGYELLPIVNLSAFCLANLADASALIGPSLSWSIADEAALGAGAYIGVGERPEDIDLDPAPGLGGATTAPAGAAALLRPRSEFGLSPAAVFVELKAYF
jgi:hypothetical protein